MLRIKKIIGILFVAMNWCNSLVAENKTVYNSFFDVRKDFVVSQIKFEGNEYLDEKFLLEVSGLKISEKINIANGDLSKAIKNVINHDIVEFVEIFIENENRGTISLIVKVVEFSRLENIEIEGLNRSLHETVIDSLKIIPHSVLSKSYIEKIKSQIEKKLEKENFLVKNIRHEIIKKGNFGILKFYVKEDDRKRIGKIIIKGNTKVDSEELKSKLKNNHQKPRFSILSNFLKKIFSKNFISILKTPISLENTIAFVKDNVGFSFSTLNIEKLEEDKKEISDFLKSKGYIDAEILNTKIYESQSSPYVNLIIEIDEKEKYKIGEITISGNTLFSTDFLLKILNLKKGQVYNKDLINERISSMMAEHSIAALYYSYGFLQFRASLIEKTIKNNNVNIEIEIKENDIYKIGKVSVQKNTLTHDNIILRETSVLPGENFDGSKLARSFRDLAMLQILDPASLNPSISVDQKEKKVHVAYNVKESPKIGASFNAKLDDTVGIAYGLELSTNNASLSNIFRKMMPLGSNQYISLSSLFNADGQKHSFSFNDPMLSEKYPHSLSLGLNFSKNKVYDVLDKANQDEFLKSFEKDEDVENFIKKRKKLGKKWTLALNAGWGKKLTFMDYSVIKFNIMYKYINYLGKYSIFDKGKYKKGDITNLSFELQISRDTRDGHIFPKNGYCLSFLGTFTPPYSLFSKRFVLKKNDDIEKIKFMEYHQTIIDFAYYKPILGDLIANVKLHTGFLGSYGGIIGPFERFSMGGTDSYKSRGVVSLEHISLRGYDDDALTPIDKSSKYSGGVIFQKAVFELKYPLIESAIFHLSLHSFIETGNCWAKYKKFNILDMKGSFGFGFRAYIGLVLNTTIGLDFGCPINQLKNKNQSFLAQFSMGIGR